MRNLPILDELNSCDVGVVPTTWQKQQFPKEFHHKLQVIFDGIDMNFSSQNQALIKPLSILRAASPTPNKTYPTCYLATRVAWKRGFPGFSQQQPVRSAIPNLQVVIAGRQTRLQL